MRFTSIYRAKCIVTWDAVHHEFVKACVALSLMRGGHRSSMCYVTLFSGTFDISTPRKANSVEPCTFVMLFSQHSLQ